MFYIISKLLAFLSKPIIWVFILLISALIFKSKSRKLLIYSLITFYVFSNSFIADSCSRMWETPRFYPTEIYDVGIVLGGIADYDKITAYPTDCTISYVNFSIEYLLLPRVDALDVWENLINEWIGYIIYKVSF